MIRRSLLSGSGGSVTLAALRSLASSPHGGWDQGPVPIAHGYNNKTYLTWFNGGAGNIETAAWDNTTHTLSSIGVAFSAVPYDDHNAACLMMRNDGRMMVAWSPHNADNIYLRINDTAETVTWASESVINIASQIGASGGGGYTYISLIQLRGVSGNPIYCFFRDSLTGSTTGRIGYTVSTNGGVTWGAKVILFAGTTGNVPYFSIASDWSTRIDIFTTDTAPGNVGSGASVYHMYINGTTGTYHKTDGTAITSPPFGTSNLTLVESGASGAAWPFGASYDASGRPAAVVMRHLESPTNDNDIQVARWTGSSWSITNVTTAGGLAGGDRFASGADIRHDLADRIYCSRLVSSQWEVFEYTSNDNWATSFGTQLTFSSSNLNWEVRCPHEPIGLRAAWLNGTFVSSSNFSYRTDGWG